MQTLPQTPPPPKKKKKSANKIYDAYSLYWLMFAP